VKPEESRSPGELRFHYDREAREAGLSEYAKRHLHPPKGLFRRNRSLLITMIDVAILVILFLSVTFYLRTRPDADDDFGFTLRPEAYLSDGRLFVTLTFERTAVEGAHGPVRVFLRSLPDDVRVELSSTLPEAMGATVTLRGALDVDSVEPTLFATIDYDTGSEVIRIEVGTSRDGS
jgi:hypothetical protein